MYDWNSLRMTKAGRISPGIWNALVAKVREATLEWVNGGNLTRTPGLGTGLDIAPAKSSGTTITPAPLTLTTTPPVGWVAPESDTTDPDNVPKRVWLSPGTFDTVVPVSSTVVTNPASIFPPEANTNLTLSLPYDIFINPVAVFAPTDAVRRVHVWLTAKWNGMGVSGRAEWTEVGIGCSHNSTAWPLDADLNTEASPGQAGEGWRDFYVIYLGQVNYSGTATKTVSRYDVSMGGHLFSGWELQSIAYSGFDATKPPGLGFTKNLIVYRR